MNSRLFAFDFDGTIADTEAIKIRCFRSLFEENPDVEKIDRYNRAMRGVPRRVKLTQIARKVFDFSLPSEEYSFIEECIVKYERVLEVALREASLIKGVVDFLEQIDDDKCIVSAAPHQDVCRVSEGLGVADFFKSVRGDVGDKGSILLDYKQKYKHVCYFGDGRADYEAACFARVPFVGIVNEENRPWFEEKGVFYTGSYASKDIFNYLHAHW